MTNGLIRAEAPRIASVDDPILADAELWDIVSSGDLKGLSPKQRADYYLFRCRQEGLNPASQPFTYLVLNGKGVLYGNKTAADQLRKLHGISIVKVECSDDGEYITYEVTVRDREGREDFELGSVHVGAAKGPDRANAKMKALTKAKRRATYSICGTGVLDETEVDSAVPAASPGGGAYAAFVVDEDGSAVGAGESQPYAITSGQVNQDTGEIISPPLNLDDDIKRLRLALGWSDPQTVIDEAAHANPPINLRSRQGKQLMVDRLQGYVDTLLADDEPAQGGLIYAESRPAGEPGLDRHSA